MATKKCKRCNEVKPLALFYRADGCRGGYRPECKACFLARQREYRQRPEVRKYQSEYQKTYRKASGFKERNRSYQKEYSQKPHVIMRRQKVSAAHTVVNHAVRAGNLAAVATLDCVDCGNQAHDYHHHNGYDESRWLDIVPLCRPCHNVRHAVAGV